MSAMLPNLSKNRYTSELRSDELDMDANQLNFIKASRKQLKEAIGLQQPKAKRFYDDSLNVP